MPNAVMVATNSANATEGMKFRLEYQIEGVGGQNFDWEPDFSMDSTELLADLIDTVQAVILARHGLTIEDDEIIVLGVPITSHA
ncbi:MAG TPA: hypothetical protein VH593_11470 [Ktedonobacteraceae bacterium]|jgi:hypothetical protein